MGVTLPAACLSHIERTVHIGRVSVLDRAAADKFESSCIDRSGARVGARRLQNKCACTAERIYRKRA